jgi:kynureninase
MTLSRDILSRDILAARDATDALAAFRDRFTLPDGVLYLDGNSLGALPRATAARVAAVVTQEWGTGLIRSWNDAGWIDLATRVGDKIARLVGAAPGSVVVADSTSVNLFKLLGAALALRPERRVILSEQGNFPTDLYIAEGLAALLERGHRLRTVRWDEILGAIDDDVAVVMLTQVNYHTGRLHDMAEITRAAHAKGALVLWDLAHTAGALPVQLAACDVDFAVGCGYKFLNGGPGAPAFLHVNPRLQETVRFPITGWFGHAAPFAFEPSFRAGSGMAGALVGTPPVLSLSALEVGVDLALEADLALIRAKSVAMTEAFADLVQTRCAGHGLQLASPADAAARGSQVCLAHPQAYAIMQALIARGVIGDFRAPDILRFGITPLYLRFADLWDAVEILRDVLDSGVWREERFQVRRAVT